MKRKLYLLTTTLCLVMLHIITIQAQPAMERPSIYTPTHSPFADKIKVKTEWVGEMPIATSQNNEINKDIIKVPEGGGNQGPTHEVQVTIECDQTTQKPFSIVVLNQKGQIVYTSDLQQPGTFSCNLPEGTFDIVARFLQLDETATYETNWLIVIHELVTINEPIAMTFSAEEAKNHISIQTLTINGEPVNTGLWHQDENGYWTCVEQGNIDEVYFFNCIGCLDYDVLIQDNYSGQFGVRLDTESFERPLGEMASEWYVNDVSERIVFNSYRVAISFNENNVYTSNYEVQGASGDVALINDPSEYSLYSDSFDRGYLEDIETLAYLRLYVYNPKYAGGPQTMLRFSKPMGMDLGEKLNLYLGASPDKSSYPFVPILIAGRSFQSGWDPYWVDEPKPIFEETLVSQPLYNVDGHAVIACCPSNIFWLEHSDEASIYGQYNHEISWYPTHPALTIPVEKKKGDLGNNCPLLITTYDLQDYTAFGGPLLLNYSPRASGRYGEWLTDYEDRTISAKSNGEQIEFMDEYTWGGYVKEALHGDVEIQYVTNNIKVDDLSGSNNSIIHFDADADDAYPPTLTSLMFKDNEGFVTDHFENNSDGLMEFMAGDFNTKFGENNSRYYTRFQPATVEVSYSPYQANEWNELAVEEVPEYYWPLLGWFYQGSLAGVTTPSENGWFDLKFRLVDEAGNWQEQTLSPAFRIDALVQSAVTEVRDGSAHEVARYSIDGKRVDTSHRGVTIIRMSDGTAHKVLVP